MALRCFHPVIRLQQSKHHCLCLGGAEPVGVPRRGGIEGVGNLVNLLFGHISTTIAL